MVTLRAWTLGSDKAGFNSPHQHTHTLNLCVALGKLFNLQAFVLSIQNVCAGVMNLKACKTFNMVLRTCLLHGLGDFM